MAPIVAALRLRLGRLRRRRRAAAAARRRHRRAALGNGAGAGRGGVGRRRLFVLLPAAGRLRHRRSRGLDRVRHLHRDGGHRRRAGVARRTARRRGAGRPPRDRAALSGAAGRVRARQRSGSGAAQRAAQSGAARRADPQPADAADLDQGGGHRADSLRRLEPELAAVDGEPPRAAAGDRRGVGPAEPLHRRALDARSRRPDAADPSARGRRRATSCDRGCTAPRRSPAITASSSRSTTGCRRCRSMRRRSPR